MKPQSFVRLLLIRGCEAAGLTEVQRSRRPRRRPYEGLREGALPAWGESFFQRGQAGVVEETQEDAAEGAEAGAGHRRNAGLLQATATKAGATECR